MICPTRLTKTTDRRALGSRNDRAEAEERAGRENSLANRRTHDIVGAHGVFAPHNPAALHRPQPQSRMVPLWAGRLRHATIVYFILSLTWPQTPLLTAVDVGIGLLILLDLAARFWISENRRKECFRLYTIADLLGRGLASCWRRSFTDDLAFLRILRALRLIHSYHLIRDLRRESRFFRLHEDTIPRRRPSPRVHLRDGVAGVRRGLRGQVGCPAPMSTRSTSRSRTLTTTGFGDITLTTPGGKLLTVFHHGGRRRLVPATGTRHLPAFKGALHMPGMRPEPATTPTRSTASIAESR